MTGGVVSLSDYQVWARFSKVTRVCLRRLTAARMASRSPGRKPIRPLQLYRESEFAETSNSAYSSYAG